MPGPEQISRRLKLRQLETLLAVAQAGSMARAAEHLAVTQPVISKSIADLESTLGVRLLERSVRGVEPTLYGRALLQRITALFNDLRTSVTELEHLSDPTAGELRIGSSEAVATGMLGVIIDRLSRRHPRLTFAVTLGGDIADLPHRDLRNRAIDLIIGRLPGNIPDDMEAVTLYNDRSFIVATAQHPLTRRRKVTLAELLNESWCGPSFDNFPWSIIGNAFRENGLEVPRNVVRVRDILARNSLLATGRFLTVLPKTVLRFSPRGLMLKPVPVQLDIPTYPVGIVTLKGRTLNPIARLFIACAREVSNSLAREPA